MQNLEMLVVFAGGMQKVTNPAAVPRVGETVIIADRGYRVDSLVYEYEGSVCRIAVSTTPVEVRR